MTDRGTRWSEKPKRPRGSSAVSGLHLRDARRIKQDAKATGRETALFRASVGSVEPAFRITLSGQ